MTSRAIINVIDRDGLPPRRDPYWAKISKGCFIGFRKMTRDTEGTWLARYLDDADNRQKHRALGDYSEWPANQRYGKAKADADEWFKSIGKGGPTGVYTVKMACENYIDHLRDSKGDKAGNEVEARFNAHAYGQAKLMSTELFKLKPEHIGAWRKALKKRPTVSGPRRGEERTDSSLNRDMTALRAALNHAYKEGLVTSDFAWRGKLLPIENADKRRNDYLTKDDRKNLIGAAADDLGAFLRGMCLLPLRPGALAALTVADFDPVLKTLRIGKDKSGQDRKISLPDSAAAFFAGHAKSKTPAAPLLMRENGKAWDKDAWKYPVKECVGAAELPGTVTAYAIRHSVITDLIHAGVPSLTVAQLSGTSVLMIEKHYGHLTQDQAKLALAGLAL